MKVIGPLAYQGKVDCQDVRCRRMWPLTDGDLGPCYGWHCSYCDEPCGPQGHGCDAAETLLEESRRLNE